MCELTVYVHDEIYIMHGVHKQHTRKRKYTLSLTLVALKYKKLN